MAYAKANPGKVRMASGGTGSGVHLGGELLSSWPVSDLLHVPYRDTMQALDELMAGMPT